MTPADEPTTGEREPRSTGYHASPEALVMEMRKSSLGWEKRAKEEGFWQAKDKDIEAKAPLFLANLMAASYSAALADILHWIDSKDADLGLEAAVIVDDTLTNGGSIDEAGWAAARLEATS